MFFGKRRPHEKRWRCKAESREEKKVSSDVVVTEKTSFRTRRNSVFFGKQRPREKCWPRVGVWHGERRQQAIQAAALTTACTRRGYRRPKSAASRAFRVSCSKGSPPALAARVKPTVRAAKSKGGRKFCQYGVLHIVKHSEAKFSNGADSHGSFTRPSFAGKRKLQVAWSLRGSRVFEQSEFPPLFGQRKPRSSVGVTRPVSRGKEGFK